MAKKSTGSNAESERFQLYDRLDRLEELIEDMAELGVESAADAERQILELNQQIDALEDAEAGGGE
jgi:hypothetical protein